jgi:ABC-2 type transport system permease protein
VSAIFKREFRSYFNSMIGYIFIAVTLAFVGIYFMAINLVNGYPYFSYTLASTTMFFLFCIPILTMRSMAEERRNKTDQLLLTAPVSVGRVVMGKFLAMAAVLLIPMAVLCVCPLILRAAGSHGAVSDYATILAMYLLGCMFIAIGMFISSLTENQIIAAVGTFFVLLVLYQWDDLVDYLPSTLTANVVGCLIAVVIIALLFYLLSGSSTLAMVLALIGVVAVVVVYFVDSNLFLGLLSKVLGSLSVTAVLDDFAFTFVFDWTGLVFYLSVTALFLFLTAQSVQKRRWA